MEECALASFMISAGNRWHQKGKEPRYENVTNFAHGREEVETVEREGK